MKLPELSRDLLMTKVVDEFRSLASERHRTLQYLPPDDTIEVCLDAPRILQVIRNLVSNAVKFSAQGGTIMQGFEAGADDYIIKPFAKQGLLTKVRCCLES